MDKKELDIRMVTLLNFFSEEDKRICLKSNNFDFLFEYLLDENYAITTQHRISEQVNYVKMMGEIVTIGNLFDEKRIRYCVFKGVVLANLLYDEPYRRGKGDIDVFVHKNDIDMALSILKDRGYFLKDKEGIDNPHHIVLCKQDYTLELHKSFIHPWFEINESYLENNISAVVCNGHIVSSLGTTAVLLHLLYHLYMDICLTTRDEYALFLYKDRNFLNKTIYRLYEILLYALEYNNDINWVEFLRDILNQNLSCEFKYLFMIINRLFAGIVPSNIMQLILGKNYRGDLGTLANYLFNHIWKNGCDTIEKSIMDYIALERSRINNARIISGQNIIINLNQITTKPSCCLSYDFRKEEGILSITVFQEGVFFNADKADFDTVKNDGVGILIYNDVIYRYISLFFCLKYSERPEVIITDISTKEVIDKNSISVDLSIEEGGYTMKIFFSSAVLEYLMMQNSFYLGLFLSSVDPKIGYRRPGYIGTGSEKTWYSPVGFIQINRA